MLFKWTNIYLNFIDNNHQSERRINYVSGCILANGGIYIINRMLYLRAVTPDRTTGVTWREEGRETDVESAGSRSRSSLDIQVSRGSRPGYRARALLTPSSASAACRCTSLWTRYSYIAHGNRIHWMQLVCTPGVLWSASAPPHCGVLIYSRPQQRIRCICV